MIWNKGKPWSRQVKDKMSKTIKNSFKTGRVIWNKGIPMKEETKDKIRKTKAFMKGLQHKLL